MGPFADKILARATEVLYKERLDNSVRWQDFLPFFSESTPLAKDNLHDTAALRALADGIDHTQEIEEPDAPAEEPAGDPEVKVMPSQINPRLGVNPVVGFDPTDTPDRPATTRKDRAKKFQARQSTHSTHAFRKTAIPLLIGMGVLLVFIAAITMYLKSGMTEEQIANNKLMENGGLFSLICVALGICLIAGAGFFHMEVTRDKKKADAEQARNGG